MQEYKITVAVAAATVAKVIALHPCSEASRFLQNLGEFLLESLEPHSIHSPLL
jgi:hypothetical protein